MMDTSVAHTGVPPDYSESHVVVVGSIHLDQHLRVERLPRPGETILAGGYARSVGGKGANQAVALSRLGVSTSLVGAIGSDPEAQIILTSLSSERVDLSQLQHGTGESGRAVIVVDSRGENVIVVAPGASGRLEWRAESIGQPEGRRTAMLLQNEVQPGVNLQAAQGAKSCGALVVFNCAPAPHALTSEMRELLRLTDVLVVNELEGDQLLRLLPERATTERTTRLAALGALGPRVVVATFGSGGAAAWSEGSDARCAAHPIDAVDSVGAGDAFTAHFTAAFLAGHRLDDALALANASGALAAQRVGTISSLPELSDVLRFMNHAPRSPFSEAFTKRSSNSSVEGGKA